MTMLHGFQNRKRPHGIVILGLALGLGGLAVLVAPGRVAGVASHVDPLGAAALLSAALFWAIGSLYSRKAALPSSTLLATAMEMTAGGLILLATAALAGEWRGFSLAAVSGRSFLALAYLIVAGSLLGFTAYIFLLGATTPARVSTYAYVNPVVAMVLGWAILGETLTLRTFVAATIIVAAVALIIRHDAGRQAVKIEEDLTPLRAAGDGSRR
jgi:drug/metabolite transporter (DMT)-like permease